ncbi:TRAP-type C4-dicarboxylate transport system, small permease component [Acidovorax sp. CF316]|uniref:TRAP transporter small permease n=1 Tax=Acidovorax sp. CF316 TaxID=1144317 RepID=UPI00026BE5B0|nr:TRAP transporter small permease subunit [Acidovorax sp. CF316]EJE48752.1 TRAP-type C4-dicarboxylate transport system, small permease component [Acidovorax sp. CF316]
MPSPAPASTPPATPPRTPVRWLLDFSSGLLRMERHLLTALMMLLVGLILLNVVTRYTGMPIYWIDEAAVYTVVWLTFVGASVMTRLRMDFAVTMLTDQLGARAAKAIKGVATAGVVLFGMAMLWMCWQWMDPIGIARYGFDAKEYAAESFNFLYTERTQTLNWPTWVLQLILPIFSATFSVHALANLLEDLGCAERRTHPGFDVVNADAVN